MQPLLLPPPLRLLLPLSSLATLGLEQGRLGPEPPDQPLAPLVSLGLPLVPPLVPQPGPQEHVPPLVARLDGWLGRSSAAEEVGCSR